ncbi:hypothetical protein PYCC9005_004746 [Savitreella phatthalungensis]
MAAVATSVAPATASRSIDTMAISNPITVTPVSTTTTFASGTNLTSPLRATTEKQLAIKSRFIENLPRRKRSLKDVLRRVRSYLIAQQQQQQQQQSVRTQTV